MKSKKPKSGKGERRKAKVSVQLLKISEASSAVAGSAFTGVHEFFPARENRPAFIIACDDMDALHRVESAIQLVGWLNFYRPQVDLIIGSPLVHRIVPLNPKRKAK